VDRVRTREELALRKLLDRWGKYFVYLRVGTQFYCSCWKDQLQEPDSHHAECWGTGRSVQIEKWLGSLQLNTPWQQDSVPSIVGMANLQSPNLFLHREAFPKAEDIFFEVEWNVSRDSVPRVGITQRLVTIYRVSMVEHIYGASGDIVGHRCGSSVLNWNLDWYQDLLKHAHYTPTSQSNILIKAPSSGASGR
jgi:hypothetical protein